MKKIGIILISILILMSAACSGNTQKFELTLITDLGSIDDKSFNQGSWEGLYQYAVENNLTYKYYKPAEQGDDAYLSTIDLAVRGGAKVVVTPGFLFEQAVFIAHDRYPDVHFILVDGAPNDGDWSKGAPVEKINANAVGVKYAEDQAGFLAGYAAVIDGYRRLGFVGGMAVPAVVRFGYGFVQGAEYAAVELGLQPGSVIINYHYTGGFSATPEAQTLSASWFNEGVEVIFACGGAVGNSVMAAAEQTGKKVIGVDVDQSGESPAVITSSMKGLQASVYDCIAALYEGNFPGGQTLIFDASNDGVGLPMSTSKFQTFSMTDYEIIFQKLVDGVIPRILNLDANGSPGILPLNITRIIEI